MNGRIPWDAMEALRRTPVVGLDWGSFLALAPSVKGQLGRGLILEKATEPGRTEVAKVGVWNKVERMAAGKPKQEEDQQKVVEVSSIQTSALQTEDMGFLYGDAIPEPSGPITNFYTEGRVTNQVQGILRTFRIPKVLIDGGAVVNLMSEAVVLRLGLPCEANDDVIIRTATNELHPMLKRARFNIEIAGVLASIRVYILDQALAYSLILGRRWMQQVRAIGDYRTHSYVIFDQGNKPHVVPVSTGNDARVQPQFPEVLLNPKKTREQMDFTDAEYEELALGRGRMDALLNQVIQEAEEEIDEWDGEEATDDGEESEETDQEERENLNHADQEEPEVLYLSKGFIPTMAGKGWRY